MRKDEFLVDDTGQGEVGKMRGLSSYFRGGSADTGALANLAPLSDTADEVRAIAEIFGEGTSLSLGGSASETEVKRLPLDQ